MKRNCMSLCSLFVCLLSMNSMIATDFQDIPDAKNGLRISEMLPEILCSLAVNPGIPADFVALYPEGTHEWIYWGPEDVLKAYFENPASLTIPILRVSLSLNTIQKNPYVFNDDEIESIKMLKKNDPKGFAYIETQWGDYPVLAVRTLNEGKLLMVAWVGLNDPDGWILLFNLVYPNQNGHPNRRDRELWESLIMKTTQLTDGDFFRAYGQDLQPGYTLVSTGGAKLKMLAEKRQSDGTIQVVVVPAKNVEFHYENMEEGLMAAQWKQGEPMVKVHGKIVMNDEKYGHCTNFFATSIFFNTVSEFSINKEDISDKNYLIIQKKSDE